MKFSTRFFISLSSLANVIIAASEEFTLKLQADGTALAGDNIHISSDNKFFISDTDQTATGQIEDDGTLKINGYTVGVGKNYLSLTADSSSFMTAEPWSIVGGQLKLYGSNFHAVPSGQNGIYVLGTINAASGRSDVVNVAIEAQGSNGKSVADYDASAKSSSVQSSSSSSSSTEASSTPVSSAEQTTTSTSSSIVESTSKKETSSTVASSAKTSVFSSEPEPSSEGTTSAVPESSSQLPASSSTQEEVPKSSTAAASSSTEMSSSTVVGSISSAIESTSSAVGSTGSPAITSSSASITRSATLSTVSSSNLSSSAASIQTFDNAGMKKGASVFAAVVAGIALF